MRWRVVGEAVDGEEAVAQAARLQPEMVLLDLSMPRMDGLEALIEIRRASAKSRVVVLSGFGEARLGDVARELGAVAYVEKGVLPAELMAVLGIAHQHLPPPFQEPPPGLRDRIERLV